MKNHLIKSIFIITLLLINTISFAQVKKVTRKIISILPEQSVYLNGTSNGYFYGGKSRIDYKIDLPPNTIEWYYTFSTTPTEGSKINLGLVSQLTRLFDPSGITSIAISSIKIPTGSGVVDLYVMNSINRRYFFEKDALGAWSYESPGGYDEGKSLNARQGSLKINDIKSGTIYLGLKNPSKSTGINVTIEVAALVEETIEDNSIWSDEVKKTFSNELLSIIKKNDIEESISVEITNCIIDKLTTQYTPEDYNNLSSEFKSNLLNQTYKTCISKYQEEKSPEQNKGMTFGNLGWKSYENGDLEKAIEYSKKALTFDNSLGFVKANLGLFSLIKGEESSAMDFYVDAITDINKNKLTAKKYLLAVLDDINQASKKYSNFRGYQAISDLINDELKRY